MIVDMLIIIDAQNDFISGSLGNPQCEATVDRIAARVEEYKEAGKPRIFTLDTHTSEKDYLASQEGKKLPVIHCIRGTEGWFIDERISLNGAAATIEKDTFGTLLWRLPKSYQKARIEVCGFDTDICVISNIIILKTLYPEIQIIVNGNLCWGSTKEKHKAALKVLESLQVEVINE